MSKTFVIGSSPTGASGSSGSWSGSSTLIVTDTGVSRPAGNANQNGDEVFVLDSVTATGCSGGSAGLYLGSTTNATTAWNGRAVVGQVYTNATKSTNFVYGSASGARCVYAQGSGGYGYDNHGDSFAGRIRTQTVAWHTVPSVPAAINTTESTDTGIATVTFTFSASSDDGGSDISTYSVDLLLNGTWSNFTSSVAPGSHTSESLASAIGPGTEYRLRVHAINVAGDSGFRQTSLATTPDVPATMSAPKLQVLSSTSVKVTWTEPSNGGSALVGYVLARPGNTVAYQGPTTSVTLTGLAAGSTQQFKVYAYNSWGDGAYSALSAAVALQNVPATPVAPIGKSSSASSIAWSWAAPANNGAAITSYTLQLFKGGVSQEIITGITGTSYTTSGLLLSTAYTAEILAVNAVGAGSYSAQSAAVTTLAGDYAPNLTQIDNTSSIFHVQVTAPTAFPGTETLAAGIQIQVSTDPNFSTGVQTYTSSAQATATLALGTGSGDGLTWTLAEYYFIQAAVKYSDGTWSDFSDSISLTYGGGADAQVGNGSKFTAAQAYLGDGTNWKPISAFVGDGTNWLPLT